MKIELTVRFFAEVPDDTYISDLYVNIPAEAVQIVTPEKLVGITGEYHTVEVIQTDKD